MRLPGTGDGVALLVEVSMVKVDMARLLASKGQHRQCGRSVSAMSGTRARLQTSNPTGASARRRVMERSSDMVDRHMLGDLGLAVLLALPLAALAWPQPAAKHPPDASQALASAQAPVAGRISLLG
jgi:hypothetical protein